MQWKPRSQKVLILANGEPPSRSFLNKFASHTLIAVNGGLKICQAYGLEPELILGDFDSVSREMLQRYPDAVKVSLPSQDKSDLEKALEFLAAYPLFSISICGATGKRLDQTLANICLLCRYPAKVKFESEIETCFALPRNITTPCNPGQNVSLIPLAEVTYCTSIGLKWELKEAVLNKHFFSLSNQCVGSSLTLSFRSGDLILCLNH